MEKRELIRKEILYYIEKNSRANLGELAVLLGTDEVTVANEIAERICNYPEVHAVYLISGGYDLLVSLEGKTLKEVSQFVSEKLSTLDSVISTATHFILKTYKDHGTILSSKSESERMLVTP